MAVDLPPEIWNSIAKLCVLGETAGHHWIVEKRPWQYHRKWTALRALTQVNRASRASAMPIMWKQVNLKAVNEDFPLIENLDQLRHEISIKMRALPTAASYMEHLNLEIALGKDCQSSGAGHANTFAQSQTSLESESLKLAAIEPLDRRYRRYVSWHSHGAQPSYLEGLLNGLSAAIAACSRLRSFSWRSSSVPPPTFVFAVADLPALQAFALDLGRDKVQVLPLPNEMASKQWIEVCQTREYKSGQPSELRQVFLGFKLSSTTSLLPAEFCNAGIGIVDWLVTLPSLTNISLSAPDFTFYCWTLPLWAHVDILSHCGDPGATPSAAPLLREDDAPWFKAAQAFSSLLKAQIWPKISGLFLPAGPAQSLSCSVLVMIADLICTLINEDPTLSVWTFWFPADAERWPRRIARNQQGYTILCKVAEVLIKKMTKRKRLAIRHPQSGSPPWCLCRKIHS
ncbi:unnamed protein product [Sympodiomycopsis kandeliae]